MNSDFKKKCVKLADELDLYKPDAKIFDLKEYMDYTGNNTGNNKRLLEKYVISKMYGNFSNQMKLYRLKYSTDLRRKLARLLAIKNSIAARQNIFKILSHSTDPNYYNLMRTVNRKKMSLKNWEQSVNRRITNIRRKIRSRG